MSFNGYLIKATKTNIEFPNKYIAWESYDSTPNQREEIKAYRDENTRNLTRVTATGHKTKIVFKTLDNLHLAEKQEIQNWFTSAESDSNQRKINLEYWNDEDNTYKTADFYRPDIKFTMKKVTSTDITYKQLEISLVEY